MLNIHRRLVLFLQCLRKLKYRVLSDCQNVEGSPRINQPVQFLGRGKIVFRGNVNLGCYPSPFFFKGYIYIEARHPDAVIELQDGVWINNSTCLISDGPGIFIGEKSMLGTHCEVIDSDFHETHPDRRMDGVPKGGKVIIGKNVMIGSNVKILKGVKIGDNSVVANGTVVNKSIPANMLAFGNPVKCGPLVQFASPTSAASGSSPEQ